jgi:membrane fusion protein (multidrug efflux system)
MLQRMSGKNEAYEHDIIDIHEPDQHFRPASERNDDGGLNRHQGKPGKPTRQKNNEETTSEGKSQFKDDQRADDEEDLDRKKEMSVWKKLRRHKSAVAITLIILIVSLIAGVIWYLNARHFESTDDAFIDGHPVSVSPEVTGNIVKVPVNDNQLVKAGDLLAEIDPRDYRAALQQAVAQIGQAEASIMTSKAQVAAQQAQIEQTQQQVEQAQATLSFARDQDARAQQLVKSGAGTVQNAQQTASNLKSSQAAFDAAIASRLAAERQINVLQAQIQSGEAQLGQARAQKASAEANLSRTQLHATVDGRVTKLTAALGASATPGQALMVLVPLNLWVTANFKETQLRNMHPGQSVEIEIDAYGRSYPGHVDSIQAGSGTAFSLLPAENATGNYVKVVQRVPVKLTFDRLPDVEIGPGMSVVPSVRVR